MLKTVETAMETSDEPAQPEPKAVKKHRGLKAMPYIIGNETFEKLGTVGTSANLMVYLTTVFNMKRFSAALLINVWTGTINFATLVGALLSDAYFGRYKTIGFCCIASFLGMVLLLLTAAVPRLHPSDCGTGDATTSCMGPTTGQLALLYFALGFLVVGAGGIRPCCLPFGVDQFDPKTESGKRGINSFFNWYYFTFTAAMMISVTIIIYVQDAVSWAVGFGIPTILMLLSCVVFFAGSRIYIKVIPDGGPFLSILQVIAASIKKRGLKQLHDQPEDSLFNSIHTNSLNSKLPYTDQFRFLDKAAIITQEDSLNTNGFPINPWRLCSVQQVEELKCIIRVIPIWASGVFYYIANAQQSTYVVIQALQSDRRFGSSGFKIPAASFIVFSMATVTIWIPIYDRIIIPYFRKITGKVEGITLLQRMGIGIFICIIGMLVSGVVEERRRREALHHPLPGSESSGGAISSMSALWLVPQLVLSGLSEAFNTVGHLEFYYKQFPENMRSVGGSLFFLGMAGTSYLNTLFVEMVHRYTEGNNSWLPEDVNKGRLEFFYYFIAGIEVVNLILFLLCAKWYRYKGNGVPLDAPTEATIPV